MSTVQEKISIMEDVIEQVQMHGTIGSDYTNGKGCYCAVGWVMKACNIDMSAFEQDSSLNGEFINDLMQYDYLGDLLKPLEDFGFTSDELTKLQYLNDQANTPIERAVDVQNYLKSLIEELKQEA